MFKRWVKILLIVMSINFSAFFCSASDTLTTTQIPEIPTPGIYVDMFEINFSESTPGLVEVVVKGNLANPCLKLDEPKINREGNIFYVNLIAHSQEGMCIQVLAPFEQKISLDVKHVPYDEYTVDVHGLTKRFELKMTK